MSKILIQRASLAGQVIEDLTFEALRPGRFEADLAGVEKLPQYKQGGFFVFSDIPPGSYRLRVSGGRYQTWGRQVEVSAAGEAPPALDQIIADSPGDNEVLVFVSGISDAPGNGDVTAKKVQFAPLFIERRIPVGSLALAEGFSGRLVQEVVPGRYNEVTLDQADGLSPGALLRIVRSRSIRLKFNPYQTIPLAALRIGGRVAGEAGDPLPGVRVRLVRVGDSEVRLLDVEGAMAAIAGSDGGRVILGTEKDVAARTDKNGAYVIYSTRIELFEQGYALEASKEGFRTQLRRGPVGNGSPHNIHFQLDPA